MSQLMTEAHKHKINRNRLVIGQNLIVSSQLLDILKQDYTLTNEHVEQISIKQTNGEKVSVLLDFLIRRPDKAFDRFIYALVQTGQDALAGTLDNAATQKYLSSVPRQPSSPYVANHAITMQNAMSNSFPAGSVAAGGYLQHPHPLAMAQSQPSLFMPGYATAWPWSVSPMMMMPPHMYMMQQGAPQVSYNGQQPVMPDARPQNVDSVGSQVLKLSTAVQEIDKTAGERQKLAIKEFEHEIAFGEPYMAVEVQKIDEADAVRRLNTETVYDVVNKPRGRAVIISNRTFRNEKLTLLNRSGAEIDEMNLISLFEKLEFEVKLETNLKMEVFNVPILLIIDKYFVYGTDGEKLAINEITDMFDGINCRGLRGKPKLFFFQACQGRKKSSKYAHDGPSGIQESQPAGCNDDITFSSMASKVAEMSLEDRPGYVPELPNVSGNSQHEKADMLISYATVKGYEAWRHSELGSWFVRSLVYVFSRRAHEEHLLDMLTEVNFFMSHLETHGTEMPFRQVAEKRDTFLKKFYFFPGYPR